MIKDCFPTDRFCNIRTPFYYYNMELLHDTLAVIQREAALHNNYKVHYAVKANANPRVLRAIAACGLGADCVSGGEIRAALDAGFPPQEVVYAGVGKSDWEIEFAIDRGIACFNVESEAELRVIDEIAARKDRVVAVAFRINPNVEAHTHAHIVTGMAENKFGIDVDDMEVVFEVAATLKHIQVTGLHFHIGSQILDLDDYVALCGRINRLQEVLQVKGIFVEHINVGGGLGIDYTAPDENPMPDFQCYFATYAQHLRLHPGQTVHFELGRSVVGQCGSLISRVLYVKQGRNKRFAILDAGMTDLIRPALYQAYHRIENLTSQCAESVYDVVGPICESSDVFGKSVSLPQVNRGDLIAIRSAGAYGEIMASTYNCRELPGSVFSDDLNPGISTKKI